MIDKKLKFISVVGARPNFVKIAPFVKELKKYKDITNVLVHTGQHYTDFMSDIFFKDFGIMKSVCLNVSHAVAKQQIAEIEKKFKKVLIKKRPDLVIVVGDVNSTRACALAAKQLEIKIAHIEAGLRSFDKTMPEENNRIITDSVSDFLFTTEPSGRVNLRREGIPREKIFFVGNIMIDSLCNYLSRAKNGAGRLIRDLGLVKGEYAVVTIHRPSNVDNASDLAKMVSVLEGIQKNIKLVYPVHPRTIKMLRKFNYLDRIKKLQNLKIIKPLGYINFLGLMAHSRFIITDSGGIQEEATYLGIPCFTLRKNTERPVTVSKGTNTLIGNDYDKLFRSVIRARPHKRPRRIKFWDGKTAGRIVKILIRELKK